MSRYFIPIILFFFTISCSTSQRVGSTTKSNAKIEWEAFDNKSFVEPDKINHNLLTGSWVTYSGIYKFNDIVNEMTLTVPFIIEFKQDTFRRNTKSEFRSFKLENNIIISDEDIGIINYISKDSIIITWKSKNNYTRYSYKRN